MYKFIDDPKVTHAAFSSPDIQNVDWSHLLTVTKRDGTKQDADQVKIIRQVEWCTRGLNVNPLSLVKAIGRSLHSGIATTQINRVAVIEAGNLISIAEPQWTFVAARFVLQELLKVAALGTIEYPTFHAYAQHAATHSRFDPRVLAEDAGFNWDNLNAAIRPQRDFKYDYLGIQTLADRYLLRDGANKVVELPQHFLMRVAVGLAMAEPVENRTAWAIRFYDHMSEFDYLPSTPTLFNAGTTFPQLSSCFGANTYDNLDSIMDVLKENAHYSKFSGGTSTSYSAIRSSGSIVRSTGGKAKGPMPYAKLFDDMLNAFDQGGKRKGVGAYYIEPWHPNIYDVLKARDPGGDARSRTPDAFPALWIPDLFMERVADGGKWSLIDPATDPRLARTYGAEFEAIYLQLEAEGRVVSTIEAEDLWHLILSKIFQQGTFWPCFKDENNARYPQRRSGMVHHSNLCLTGDTQVDVIRDGKLVQEDLKSLVANFEGVEVKSYNAKTKTTEFKPVTAGALMKRKTQIMRVTDTATGKSIRVTPEHKVWTENRGYVEARSLRSEDTLRIG